jgi:uncharacterized protein YndB with AHSA1/START domain
MMTTTMTNSHAVQIGPFVDVPSDLKIEKTIEVATTRAEAWRLWSTSAGLRSFFSPNSRIDLRPGGDIEILFLMTAPHGQQGSEGCRVLAYIPEEVLVFSWNAPPTFGDLRNQHTWVVIRFEQLSPTRTTLHFTHYGFGKGDEWGKIHSYFDQAWGRVLEAFRKQAALPNRNVGGMTTSN